MKINKDTKVYGSFSSNPGNNGCKFFNEQFEKYDINAIYKSFYSTNPEKLIDSVKHLNFSGFALSMPLKISIVSYLHKVDKAAQKIGAVNTVVNDKEKEFFNKKFEDFNGILRIKKGSHAQCCIIGKLFHLHFLIHPSDFVKELHIIGKLTMIAAQWWYLRQIHMNRL